MTVNSKQLMERAGITFRQLDHWAKMGYLVPLSRDSGSQGVPRYFPDSEVVVARRMKDLLGCGFTVPASARLARGDDEALKRIDLTLSALRVSR